jgi:hypothetical protein
MYMCVVLEHCEYLLLTLALLTVKITGSVERVMIAV